MFGELFQPAHLILVLVVALIVFGPEKMPEIGKTIGKTVVEFRRAVNSATSGIQEELMAIDESVTQTNTQGKTQPQLPQAFTDSK